MSCDRKIICNQNENCISEISYRVGHSLKVGSFDVYSTETTTLALSKETEEIIAQNLESPKSLGEIDFKKLNCIDQDRDY